MLDDVAVIDVVLGCHDTHRQLVAHGDVRAARVPRPYCRKRRRVLDPFLTVDADRSVIHLPCTARNIHAAPRSWQSREILSNLGKHHPTLAIRQPYERWADKKSVRAAARSRRGSVNAWATSGTQPTAKAP